MQIEELFVILSPGALVVIREQLQMRHRETDDAPEKARIEQTLKTLAEVYAETVED